jgi:MFS family permease
MSEGSLKWNVLLLLLSYVFTVASLLCFGFSKGIELAVLSRLAAGLLNGVTPVMKKYIVQAVPESFIVKAFAALMFHFNVGGIVGPIVGGFLYDPATKYSALSSVELLKTYPILLPCAVAALFALGGIFVTPIFHKDPNFDEPQEMMDKEIVIIEADAIAIKEKENRLNQSSPSEFHVPRRLNSEFQPTEYHEGQILSAILPREDVTKALADPGLPIDSTSSICSAVPSPSLCSMYIHMCTLTPTAHTTRF